MDDTKSPRWEQDPDLIPLRHVGEFYPRTSRTVHEWIRRGKLRKYRSGLKEVFVSRTELERLIAPHADGDEG
ncbi:helix-turn-helix domain-containing protein [Sinomonas gamaensis]|uniref:helix-turn-helix domain-containing protein n=1 Tax=Sinomonas gamaensis TaxID=2565624 RepID=UPI001108C452|nr:helix-turn-helix domain-containing protein [Sinomonas gamaensis]